MGPGIDSNWVHMTGRNYGITTAAASYYAAAICGIATWRTSAAYWTRDQVRIWMNVTTFIHSWHFRRELINSHELTNLLRLLTV
jgi:hypothetical protein